MRVWSVVFLVVFLVGCVERRLFVRTEPAGAVVRVNGETIGESPAVWRFDHYGHVLVEIERDGFEPEERVVHLRAPWYQYPVADFFADVVVPARIRDDHTLEVKLEPLAELTEEEVDKAITELVERANKMRIATGRTAPAPAEDEAEAGER